MPQIRYLQCLDSVYGTQSAEDRFSWDATPTELRCGQFKLHYVPRVASSVNTGLRALLAFQAYGGFTGVIAVNNSGTGSCDLFVRIGNEDKISKLNFLDFADGDFLTFEFDAQNGSVTISGAAAGNGTWFGKPWAFGPGTFYLGGGLSAGDSALGLVSLPYAVEEHSDPRYLIEDAADLSRVFHWRMAVNQEGTDPDVNVVMPLSQMNDAGVYPNWYLEQFTDIDKPHKGALAGETTLTFVSGQWMWTQAPASDIADNDFFVYWVLVKLGTIAGSQCILEIGSIGTNDTGFLFGVSGVAFQTRVQTTEGLKTLSSGLGPVNNFSVLLARVELDADGLSMAIRGGNEGGSFVVSRNDFANAGIDNWDLSRAFVGQRIESDWPLTSTAHIVEMMMCKNITADHRDRIEAAWLKRYADLFETYPLP